MLPEFPPYAALLEPAETGRRLHRAERVEPDGTRLEPPGDPVGAPDVAGPHRGGETEARVVGHPDDVVFGVEGQHRQDRAEDLLDRDRHVGLDVGEHGRIEEVAGGVGSVATRGQRRAVAGAGLHEAHHPLAVLLGDERAHVDALAQAGSEGQRGRLGNDGVHKLLGDRPLDEQPAAGHADLTGVPEDCS